MRKAARGVTLIELMVVIVVVAILASVAVPSYRRYMIRTNRTEATQALLQLRIAQEKFFLQNNRYATAAEFDDAPPAGLGLPATTPSAFYQVAIVSTPTTFTATATAINGQLDDAPCATLTMDQAGTRGATPGAVAECWR